MRYSHRRAIGELVPVVLALGILAASTSHLQAAEKNSYGAVRDFLVAHTKVVELTGENGERVAICPEYNGRIMTSTTGDLDGRSLGWVNRPAIEKGEKDPRFNNLGGEDRFWLAPEGGPFSLYFGAADQRMSNYTVPPALNDGAFTIASDQNEPYYKLTRNMQVQNTSKTQFNLEVTREIHLQKAHHFGKLFGSEAQSAVQSGKLRMVGFQTINAITNRGAPMNREKGLVALSIVGQFPASPRSFLLFPYREGGDPEMGPVVNPDYFGSVPGDRLRINSQAIFLTGDGKFRAKIGIPQTRAKPICGSIDLEQGVLTLVHATMPQDPAAYSYLDNAWGKQPEPFRGDVWNGSNGGPAEGAGGLSGYYEIQSNSPAGQLPTGKAIAHTQTTFHIEGDASALARVAKAALGIDVRVEEIASQKTAR